MKQLATNYDLLRVGIALARTRNPNSTEEQISAAGRVIAWVLSGRPQSGVPDSSVREVVAKGQLRIKLDPKGAAKRILEKRGAIFGPITQEHQNVWNQRGKKFPNEAPQDVLVLNAGLN